MLRYEHFSLAMHQERRLAIFTATNIDGAQARRVKRGSDNWAFDPRLPETVQLGPELYADNDLDRGHLTRRLDPAWGDQTVASRAEQDTFFYTNASPQQSRFNQQIWAGLEDYLLDHADNLDFRATVFTGPIFSAADRPYRGALLPLAYWKIAVMVNALTGQLSATAYLVSQADLLPTATFTFGEYKTYQLPLARVEEMTGLAFPKLRPFDPLGTAALPQVLAGHRDIVLQPRVAAGQAVPVLGLPRR